MTPGKKRLKIAVGLSGGVDSAVSAYLLKQAGHDVFGLTMKIWGGESVNPEHRSACYGSDESHDIEDIRGICRQLDIPFHVIDLCEEYEATVIHYFKTEYQQGRTPNPCIICNQRLKFEILLDRAQQAGIEFERFATGHYARVEYNSPINRYQLLKASYREKDQSYFLAFLRQEQLSRVIFPLGDKTKEEVRKIAQKIGLPVHDKEESQDFYGGDYRELIPGMSGGNIVNKEGKVLGRHKGIHHYTIGQRRGIGISAPYPLYVVGIDERKNQVIVGKKEDLFKKELRAYSFNWLSIPCPEKQIEAGVRIRYRHNEVAAAIEPLNKDEVFIHFKEAQSAVTPGQAAVVYDGDILLGGGLIARTS